MEDSKLVSIVMPAYNCENYINNAIDSILKQTYSNFELLISDDCSNDRTKEIIDSYIDKRIKKFHNNSNLGYLQASNKLFLKCTGDLISFQDADDFSDKTRIEKLVSFLNENRDIAVVSSDINRLDNRGKFLSRSNFPTEHTAICKDFLNYKTVIVGSAMMLRKEVINDIGPYNLYFDRVGYEDFYWFSLIIQKYKVACINEPLYNYRSNPNSVTASHKSPKAIIGHDLIINMYNRRSNQKPDYIQNGDWKKADAIAELILTSNKAKGRSFNDKLVSLFEYIKELFRYPGLTLGFFRPFVASLLSK